MYGIALRYGERGALLFVAVLGANRGSTLEVAWPMTEPYAVHLRQNCLLRTPGSRTPIGLWRVVDLRFAWRIWRELAGHLVNKPTILGASAMPQRWSTFGGKKK
jgi:hypothetical protein